MNDLHEVIEQASKHGRKVILGGHSRGGSSVVSYAAWDFKDGPGFKDLDGMVVIDGGLGAFGPSDFSLEDAQAGLAEIKAGDVFNDPLGAGIPEIGPIFSELAALYGRTQPDEPAALQANPLIAAAGLAPPYAVTNESFLGYLFDDTYSPLGLSLQIRAGDFGSGDPKSWVSGENTPIEDFAKAFSREPGNATEWYYPNRMILDTSAANALERTPAADYLGLRLFHTRQINIPLYAFQTNLTGGGVLEGANTLIDRSKITKAKLVDASATTSHLDPVLAPGATNRFTKTVEPFLRDITKRR
jgi:pimeloyl-ACP methyl ester carboxylesterase